MNKRTRAAILLGSALISFCLILALWQVGLKGFWWQAKEGVKATEAPVVKRPHLVLEPNVVIWGQTIQITGKDFCNLEECSPVVIKIEERVLKEDVHVKKGSFHSYVKILAPERNRDAYLISAQQTNRKTQVTTETVAEIVIEK